MYNLARSWNRHILWNIITTINKVRSFLLLCKVFWYLITNVAVIYMRIQVFRTGNEELCWLLRQPWMLYVAYLQTFWDNIYTFSVSKCLIHSLDCVTPIPHQQCKAALTTIPWTHPYDVWWGAMQRYALYVPTHGRRRPGRQRTSYGHPYPTYRSFLGMQKMIWTKMQLPH